MDLTQRIDHSLLKPTSTSADVERICKEAIQYHFAAVCLPPFYVKDAASWLEHETEKIATVIGFPMGYSPTVAKVEEIKRAIDQGADELDVVINLCALKNGNWNYLKNEIQSLTTACHMKGKIIKTIIETGILTNDELLKIAEICADSEVDFVKTSTGFNTTGATVEVIKTLRSILPSSVKIKASGGIKDRSFAEALIEAGADRIGCSASIQLVAD